jgi:1-acyl-sn-glycerol-3-phosphate acyltransferase
VIRAGDPQEARPRLDTVGGGNRLATGMRGVLLWLNAPMAWGIFLTVSGMNLLGGVVLQLLAWPWDRTRRVALRVNHLLWGRALFALQPGWPTTWAGTEDLGQGPYIVVANHTSVLDIPVCMGLPLPLRVMAKRSLMRVPLMGWYLRFSGQIPIDASSPASVQEAMEACLRTVDSGISVLIFPEGTRSESAELRRFQRGAFRLSKDTGVPVLPVAILGTHRVVPKGRIIPQELLHHIAVRVLRPVDPENFSTARKMSNRVFTQISEELEVLRRADEPAIEVPRAH